MHYTTGKGKIQQIRWHRRCKYGIITENKEIHIRQDHEVQEDCMSYSAIEKMRKQHLKQFGKDPAGDRNHRAPGAPEWGTVSRSAENGSWCSYRSDAKPELDL